ncbi:MAG: metal ABC transporter ATP-binding protein [Thermoprotei archaeon]|nr:metal ABC transporter ATP-binding protein [Thermoprotei archaeon]
MYAVEMNDVTIYYGMHPALEGISFSLDKGSFLAIMGPNGAGKTTLLKAILGMAPLVKGHVRVMGIDVYEHPLRARKLIGYVPQKESIDATVPVLVRDVVLMGRFSRIGLFRRPSKIDERKAMDALDMVGLADLWDAPFIHLSGGQQQRVLIARALAQEPELLLLDEPFSQVDYPSQRIIAKVLRDLREEGVTIITVIHNIGIMLEYIDSVLLLNRKVIAYGRPEDVLRGEVLRRAYEKGITFIPLRR